MTTLTPEELITTLEATSQFNDNADICTADVIAALQSQAERINDLETEAEQLRKGHFDTSEANAALRSKFKGMQAEIDELRAENARLKSALLTNDTTIESANNAAGMLEAENARLRSALADIAYGLEGSRIWGGMEWSYAPLHPFKYLPLRDKARAALGEP